MQRSVLCGLDEVKAKPRSTRRNSSYSSYQDITSTVIATTVERKSRALAIVVISANDQRSVTIATRNLLRVRKRYRSYHIKYGGPDVRGASGACQTSDWPAFNPTAHYSISRPGPAGRPTEHDCKHIYFVEYKGLLFLHRFFHRRAAQMQVRENDGSWEYFDCRGEKFKPFQQRPCLPFQQSPKEITSQFHGPSRN